jgi:hypothetical protein
MALRRKLESGFIAMVQVEPALIASLTPSVNTAENLAARTAAVVNPVLRP